MVYLLTSKRGLRNDGDASADHLTPIDEAGVVELRIYIAVDDEMMFDLEVVNVDGKARVNDSGSPTTDRLMAVDSDTGHSLLNSLSNNRLSVQSTIRTTQYHET